MHPNQQTLENFYAAFARLDPDAMAACYAPDAEFDDAVFSLRGHREVTAMWHMLCDSIMDGSMDMWKLVYSHIEADGHMGKAHWEADYRFSKTGRLVHNNIDAAFEFNAQGLIKCHRDSFDFWAWSRQALGTPGSLLGWAPVLRKKVRAQAAAALQKYLAHHGS